MMNVRRVDVTRQSTIQTGLAEHPDHSATNRSLNRDTDKAGTDRFTNRHSEFSRREHRPVNGGCGCSTLALPFWLKYETF